MATLVYKMSIRATPTPVAGVLRTAWAESGGSSSMPYWHRGRSWWTNQMNRAGGSSGSASARSRKPFNGSVVQRSRLPIFSPSEKAS